MKYNKYKLFENNKKENIERYKKMNVKENTQEHIDTATRSKKKMNPRLILGVTAILAILIIASVLIYHKTYYGSRWYKNTYINGVNVSGQTLEESKKNLEKKYSDYTLTINGRDDGVLTIDGDDINYNFKISKNFDTLFDTQHESMQLIPKKNNYTTEYNISYDKDALNDIVSKSEIVKGSSDYKIKKPVSATVIYDAAKAQYTCKEEILGNKIIKENLITVIDDAAAKANTEINITNTKKYPDVYKAPVYTSKDDIINTELTLSNNAALRYITWNMGKGVTEQITPEDISKWITCKDGKVKYNNKKIAAWVEKFCLKYKTVGKTRSFKDHKGKTVKLGGGDYGWQLDYEKTLEQAKKALKKKISQDDIDAYIAEQNDESKKAITLKRKVIYANTAFQKDYVNFKEDWDLNNYIEISIADQKVYVMKNGKVKASFRCITGRPVEGRATPTGVFFIKEHKRAYTLTGDDYATPVKNWVRITWTGTGFHPATWQPWSRWTPTLYQTRGSHGCINLEPRDAEKIYDLAKYRMAVFMH